MPVCDRSGLHFADPQDGIFDDGEWLSWEWINHEMDRSETRQEYPGVEPEVAFLFRPGRPRSRVPRPDRALPADLGQAGGALRRSEVRCATAQGARTGIGRPPGQRLRRSEDHLA